MEVSLLTSVEEIASSVAWLTFNSLQKFVTKFSISCTLGKKCHFFVPLLKLTCAEYLNTYE